MSRAAGSAGQAAPEASQAAPEGQPFEKLNLQAHAKIPVSRHDATMIKAAVGGSIVLGPGCPHKLPRLHIGWILMLWSS